MLNSFQAVAQANASVNTADAVVGASSPNWCGTMVPNSWESLLPFVADVYYSTTVQTEFGEVEKTWTADRSIRVDLNASTNYKDQQVSPEQIFNVDDAISARTYGDIRVDSNDGLHALTDIRVMNVRGADGKFVYWETAGTRKGLSTVFEVDGFTPHTDPWGVVDHISIVIRRCPDQGWTIV